MRYIGWRTSYRPEYGSLPHTIVEMKSTLEGIGGVPSHTVVEMKYSGRIQMERFTDGGAEPLAAVCLSAEIISILVSPSTGFGQILSPRTATERLLPPPFLHFISTTVCGSVHAFHFDYGPFISTAVRFRLFISIMVFSSR